MAWGFGSVGKGTVMNWNLERDTGLDGPHVSCIMNDDVFLATPIFKILSVASSSK